MDRNERGSRSGAGRRIFRGIAALAIVGVIGAGIFWFTVAKGGDEPGRDTPTFTAKRGDLTISVVESGTIKARDQIIIKNEVEGRTSIISLVPEGTRVEKDQLLVQLDASALEDGKIDQEIRVQNAQAAFINAQENLAIVTSQATSDVNQAELAVEFAQQDLRKYEKGQYPKDVNEATMRITLAREELERAEEKLEWSQRLFREGYLSEMEKTADELSAKRKGLDVVLAEAELALLESFTYPRQIRQLQSDLQQAELALERARRKAEADKRQAQADLTAKESQYTREQAKLKKVENQITKTQIRAPVDGLVVYATSTRTGLASMMREPLMEGQQVHERQELIHLVTGGSTMAEVGLHEASLGKVHVGLPAVITVDTLPGKQFLGSVGLIAPLPDGASMFLNPDMKIYNTEIHLEAGDSQLRAGTSCRAEVIVEKYTDVVYVPVQAVIRIAGAPTVYIQDGKSVTPRTVEIGLDNDRMVQIVSGLKEGEVVLLAPPLEPSAGTVPRAGAAEPNATEEDASGLDQQVRDKLDASRQAAPAGTDRPPTGTAAPETTPTQPPGATPDQMRPGPPGQMPQGMPQMSAEQQKKMQQAMEIMKNLSDEEKEKLKNMSMQERIQFFEERMKESP